MLETANDTPIGSEGFSLGDELPIGEENPIGEPTVLTEEQFFEVFKGIHDVPGHMLGLQSLPIATHEMQSARAASDVIYEIANEVPAFRFLIEPGNIWLQRAMVVAAFAVPKMQAVTQELRARRAKSAETTEESEVENARS